MKLRLAQLCFTAAALAIAVVSLTGPSARAFTIETLGGGSGGGSRFADPDNQVKNFGQGSQPFGQNGPTVQFGAQPGGQSSFGRGFGSPRFVPPPTAGSGNND
jgi:hypothetical protein